MHHRCACALPYNSRQSRGFIFRARAPGCQHFGGGGEDGGQAYSRWMAGVESRACQRVGDDGVAGVVGGGAVD